jgi:hypothetical protein
MIKKGIGGLIKQLVNRPNIKKLFSQYADAKSGRTSPFGTDISGLRKRSQYDEDDKGGFQKTTGQKIAKASKGMLIKGKPKLAKKGWR